MSKLLLKINTYTKHVAYQYYKYMILEEGNESVVLGFCNNKDMNDIKYLNEMRWKYLNRYNKPLSRCQIRNLKRKNRPKKPRFIVR